MPTIFEKTRRRRLILAGGALSCIAVWASASAMNGAARRFLVRAGHVASGPLNEPIRRIVTAVAKPAVRDTDGYSYAVSTTNADFYPGEMNGWRLQILTGALIGKSYRIVGNTNSSLTIAVTNGSLGTLFPGDLVMLEQVYDRAVPPRR